MIEVSATGLALVVKASKTFPSGIFITAIADEAEITAHNDRIEHLSNAINSTYGILYCHLSFKALAV